jgi:hypothetical protein
VTAPAEEAVKTPRAPLNERHTPRVERSAATLMVLLASFNSL